MDFNTFLSKDFKLFSYWKSRIVYLIIIINIAESFNALENDLFIESLLNNSIDVFLFSISSFNKFKYLLELIKVLCLESIP